ncbi:hypothetical protein M407DRAFT_33674 [Tulasnella calospora MUT 4182]|nr:hypothetical protein M407DRAFT_33674 [Tulasnella calospora MUT 4182]
MLTGCWAAYVTKLEIDLPTNTELFGVDAIARLCNMESLKISGGSWVTDLLSSLSRSQEPKSDEGCWPNPRLISLTLVFRNAESYSPFGTSFLPTHASAVSDLVQKRWSQVADTAKDTSRLAALSSLVIRIPEELSDADSVEALASMACGSAKVLGYGVLRIISIE